ncbi:MULTISPECIES: ABC transporter substrate-binding protein [unclassified Minwuia]|jgi:branched-chain amino acid transport system substrate-binding protein|uniref:ABC transporter substrate-binding protein n=1 Tax=unclassified Minwuia TaxID=2618799 RepID=UPI0024788F2D|nr:MULTISPECIES: ABC transporter substrate-binding protein [unclassified Minwuia]
MKRILASIAVAGGLAAMTAAHAGEIVIGQMTDRTGPTANVGNPVGDGAQDYIDLINSQGGINGHTIRLVEVDNQYKVPPAVEGYQRFKSEGAVLVGLFGTPITQALTADLQKDKIPATTPGFGTALAADGNAFPYLFPAAASYWSQAGAAVEYAKQQMGGLKGKKIAYLFYDNPAGREGLPVLRKLSELEGYTLNEFPVPAPGIEMDNQARDIARRFRADFVISHLFGRAPSVQINALKRAGFPLEKVVSFVWGASEADVAAAGGFEAAEGYAGLQFAGVGDDFQVRRDIKAMLKAQGKEARESMSSTVFYNRGLLISALHVEALRNAVAANGGKADVTGTQVRDGFHAIKDFSLGGLLPPLNLGGGDHEGGGWVRVFKVTKTGFEPATEWFKGYRDVVFELIKEESAKMKN